MRRMPFKRLFLVAALLTFIMGFIPLGCASAQQVNVGIDIHYELPTTGPLPQTYRVTLAAVEAKNTHWIISQFACGVVRTVTRENQGKFSEHWNGLDDNFMPVPPGTYAVKGIYMPAHVWPIDGAYHSVTPQFVTGASAWMPSPTQTRTPEPFGGDPVGSPLRDIAVGPNGVAVFYYQYLENGRNNPMMDLNKPVGYPQFLRAFESGGAGGGFSTATDGESVWSVSNDGGPQYVYRADHAPFGRDSANRNHVYRPAGWVTALAAHRGTASQHPFVYIAQRGKLVEVRPRVWTESEQVFVDKITVLDGTNGRLITETALPRPQGLAVHGDRLYALQAANMVQGKTGFAVSTIALVDGVPTGVWQRLFTVPASIHPFDLEVDSHERVYLSDPGANHVFQLDRAGTILTTFGRHDAQVPGTYDPLTLMAPGKLATWTDPSGNDRLLIVEQAGPNRASEWSDAEKLLHEFLSLQTNANYGYALDPEHPEDIYIAGHERWLTRFKVDYARGTWTVNAVWPSVGDDPKAPGFDHPRFIRIHGQEFLACTRSFNVYRRQGSRWLLSAAIVRELDQGKPRYFLWHDANGDGRVQEEEYRPTPLPLPGRLLRYHGEQWLDDLSMVAINQGGRDVWRLAPTGFDAHGNPTFAPWERLLTDPVFTARAQHTADNVHGGNELDTTFSSDWAEADGSLETGFYVVARGGVNFSANTGAQEKLSRYVPDGNGKYRLLWRTGRTALQGLAEPGEMYGAIHLHRPLNGLLSVVDQTRCGIVLYTEDGLYVDTLFPDSHRFSPQTAGVYSLPGEFFAGNLYADPGSGTILLAMGKVTPLLFKAEGWSLRDNPVRVLTHLETSIRIEASQIAAPPEIAMSVRGGAGAARIARFSPALGGATLDGSLIGWESSEPIQFQNGAEQTVEVRGMYDAEHLYLRWHARLGARFVPKSLYPLERIFAHERGADTLSFYWQGDPHAVAGGPVGGRPGDTRFIFGLFQDGNTLKPAVLGLYPTWTGGGNATPQTYATPVGKATFAQAGPVQGARLKHVLDPDGKGFVLVAALPRSALGPTPPLSGNTHTMVNFEATFAGHSKFWWANSDGSASHDTYDEPTEARLYPGSWAPAQFKGLEKGIVLREWMLCGPWGGSGAEKFHFDVSLGDKEHARAFFDAAAYPPDSGKVDLTSVFSGPLNLGYWKDPKEVRWRAATVADLDTRVVLGSAAQVWYGATWVHVPDDMSLEFQFQGHPQTFLRFFLNRQLVQQGEIPAELGSPGRVARKTLTLRRGWNEILFRGYCVGYPPFRAGLILAGAPEKLQLLQMSAHPPQTP